MKSEVTRTQPDCAGMRVFGIPPTSKRAPKLLYGLIFLWILSACITVKTGSVPLQRTHYDCREYPGRKIAFLECQKQYLLSQVHRRKKMLADSTTLDPGQKQREKIRVEELKARILAHFARELPSARAEDAKYQKQEQKRLQEQRLAELLDKERQACEEYLKRKHAGPQSSNCEKAQDLAEGVGEANNYLDLASNIPGFGALSEVADVSRKAEVITNLGANTYCIFDPDAANRARYAWSGAFSALRLYAIENPEQARNTEVLKVALETARPGQEIPTNPCESRSTELDVR